MNKGQIIYAAMTLFVTFSANAQPLEQCSYSTEHDEKITRITEDPSEADGSNQARFVDIKRKEDAGEKGYAGYRTFDIVCRPLDDKNSDWHLFIQTDNGTVSLIGGLTESACYQGLYAADTYRRVSSGTYMVQGSDFKQGRCFK